MVSAVCPYPIVYLVTGQIIERRISFVALANEYIVDEAITLNPEAARLEDLLYRKSYGVVSKVRAARGVNRKNALLRSTTITILNGETISAADLQSELNEVTYMNEEARMLIEVLQEEVHAGPKRCVE